jgi:phenylacetic acid degradation operon negative regulatory protein
VTETTEPSAERTSERTSELLAALLGDYWFRNTGYIPSAALAALLGEFGVKPEATRAALSRASRRGHLEGTKAGRNTAYRLPAALKELAARAGRDLMAFGVTPIDWDGTWTCVAFSVPESDRRLRLALRTRLRSMAFGALFDGLWISPRALHREVDHVLRQLGIASAVVLRVTEVPRAGGVDLLSAWDLHRVRGRYDDFLSRIDTVTPRVEAGDVGSAEALAIRTDILARWRELVSADPDLPDQLMPADWPRAEARRRFAVLYDGLGPLAEARVRQLVAPFPATPPPRHHRADELLDDATAHASEPDGSP